MTEVVTQDTEAPEGPVLVESGRYKLWAQPDGSPAVARATGICERCSTCGCGEQQELLTLASMMQMAMSKGIGMGQISGAVRGLFKGGRRG